MFSYRMPMWDVHTPAWKEVLRRCGYPTDVLVIDFETYFDDEMPDSTIEFITDKRFEILSCTFTHMRGEYPFADYNQHTQFIATEAKVAEHIRYLQGQFGPNLDAVTVVAQNAVFEATILWRHHGLHPKYLIDILGLARHLNSRQRNDLAALCKQHSLPDKGDTSQFKGLSFRTRIVKPKGRGPKLPLIRMPNITDEQVEGLCQYNTNDNLREWELFTILLPQISNPQTELRIMQHTLELFTKPVLRVDYAKCEELIRLYNQQIDEAIAAVQLPSDLRVSMTLDGKPLAREHISGNKSFEALMITAIEKAGDSPLSYTKFGKKGAMLALAKSDEERGVLLTHPDPAVQGLMKARVAVKSWPLHAARVERIMAQSKAAGGVLPVPLKYHGAHTGRDSGGEKINLQNLGSRGDPLITAVRNVMVAPDGTILAIVDAAQVEARGTDWIAGQEDSLIRWRNKEDQYSHFASQVVGYRVRKPVKMDPPPIAKRLKWARDAIGKIGVLGCGYGMGPYEPGSNKTKPNFMFQAVGLDVQTAESVVSKYRETHQNIVQFWRAVERSFVYTAKYQKPCEMPRGLRFDPYNEAGVIITLPNGRELHYPRVKVELEHTHGLTGGRETLQVYNAMEHKWEYTWGGGLTENVVQAFCRDLLMEAMLRLADAGYRTVHRIHDELVLCVPEEEGPAVLKLAEAELAKTPAWAPGLPLGAEGKLSKCYGK